MVFTVRAVAPRLIAVLVLLSGMADYLAFDVGDPLAPMSSAGTASFIGTRANLNLSPPAILSGDSHDDGCIGCAPGFTARRVRLLTAEVIATTSAWNILPPPGPPLARFDRPPRA